MEPDTTVDATPIHEDESEAGLVDMPLVDEMLAMTVEQRLRQNDRMIRMIKSLRAAWPTPR